MYILPILDMLLQRQKNLSGKYAKQTLERIEKGRLNIDRATYNIIRKIILDGYNDMFREFEESVQQVEDPE